MPVPAETRKGDWIQSFSGVKFYPFDARPTEIHIEDIAHALSMICRYGGHSSNFFSVAEHSVLVSQLCRPEDALWGLLHDASEAYLGDIPRPIKHSPAMMEYRVAECDLQAVIADRFGLGPDTPVSVKIADEWALNREVLELMWPVHPDWYGRWLDPHAFVPNVDIQCLAPSDAKAAFMKRFYEVR